MCDLYGCWSKDTLICLMQCLVWSQLCFPAGATPSIFMVMDKGCQECFRIIPGCRSLLRGRDGGSLRTHHLTHSRSCCACLQLVHNWRALLGGAGSFWTPGKDSRCLGDYDQQYWLTLMWVRRAEMGALFWSPCEWWWALQCALHL